MNIITTLRARAAMNAGRFPWHVWYIAGAIDAALVIGLIVLVA
jgi:hypothetical protein